MDTEKILTTENIEEAKRIEESPELILRLIDLLFLGVEENKLPS